MEKSRTKNTIKNVKTGFIVQFINKLMSFIVRTIFIKMLNAEYLGINGLFTNILTMLSFTELGIGTAIIFNMYKPIADDDKEKLKSLMKLYKKSYNIIGLVVFVLGFCIIPFMDLIIKDAPNIKENLILIYLLFLFNTSSSYFFTYKKSIIIAYQKQSVINNIDSIFYILKSVIEIIFLIFTKNYIIYLIIGITSTFVENIILAKTAEKMFPFITEKNVTSLSKNESKGIFNNVRALVVYKFGEVVLSGTDNILLSAMINVGTVGLCSNYTLIIQAVKSVISTAFNGVIASVGNLNTSQNAKKKEKVYYQITFIYFMAYSFISVCFATLLNPFIKLWLGNEYVLELGIPIALAVSTFIEGIRLPGFIFRTTLGLFEKGKVTPYIGAIVNIIVSIILCKVIGTVGIFIGTSIAQLLSYTWIDPYLIHKYEFKTSGVKYLKKYLIYTSTFALELIATLQIINLIHGVGIWNFILKCIITSIIPILINIFMFYKTTEFKELKQRFINPLINKIKNV